jgi:hypothetical protein
MSTPARIDSIDPNGNLKTHLCTLKGKEWLDQWRAVTPQEFPEHFLYNQCADLAKKDPEKGQSCQNHVRSVAETFFRRPQTSDPQERFIKPLPDRKPLNHLYSQCKRLRSEEEDRIINNPPVIEYLRNIYSSARHSERMDSKEGSCKRDVTALKKLLSK